MTLYCAATAINGLRAPIPLLPVHLLRRRRTQLSLRYPFSLIAYALPLLSMIYSVPAHSKTHHLKDGRDDLQNLLDNTEDGDVVELEGGTWRGQFLISHAIELHGLRKATIDAAHKGTALRIDAPDVQVSGLWIQNSGSDLRAADSCIYTTPAAKNTRIINNHLNTCTFGVWVDTSEALRIENNSVRGIPEARPTDRGNGIHLFNATKVSVSGNTVTNARDGIYVFDTDFSTFSNNRTSHMRYGVHYMYSFHNTLQGNISSYNIGGFALMESGNMVVTHNVANANANAGFLFRSATDCRIEANQSRGNDTGMFFYSSVGNNIINNTIGENQIGLKLWAGTLRNTITDNKLLHNAQQVLYVASRDLNLAVGTGHGNYWSDYLGWDQNNDGVGDRPHRVNSFMANLIYRFPSAALLLRSPALELLAHLEDSMPILRTPTVVDHAPLLRTAEAP